MKTKPKIEWVSSGRTATLVYEDGERRAEAFVEMSGNPDYDGLVWLEHLREWKKPEGIKITKEEEDQIIGAILDWESSHKIRLDIPDQIRNRLKK